MSTHINYIEFKSTDLEITKTFYRKAFDWKFTDYGPNYTAFNESGLEGGFEKSEEHITNGALIVLYHNDLKTIESKIKSLGGTITKPTFSFPGGRRFHFNDPSGNVLAIWSDE